MSPRHQHLKRKVEEYEATIAGAAHGIALVELDGSFRFVNDAFCDFLERPRDLITSQAFQDYTPQPDLGEDLRLVGECIEGKRTKYQLRKRYRMPCGRMKWGHLAVALVFHDGLPSHFVSQLIDIDELMRALARLQTLQAHLKERVELLEEEVDWRRRSEMTLSAIREQWGKSHGQ